MDTHGRINHGKLLEGARVYLSGPMDFVASREDEMKNGWRNRVGAFLETLGCIVFDPWNKPNVRGLHDYGREGLDTVAARHLWTFEDNAVGAATRSKLVEKFWETLHIDLRMVDTCDFVIAYCPTNIYSVGTPHEIALCRQQQKPVLFVSPPVVFPSLDALREHLAGDETGTCLLQELELEVPIKPNPGAIPSLWYMPLIGSENFFDGFGFDAYRERFGWADNAFDRHELGRPPSRPLLPFIERLSDKLPQKWDERLQGYVRNDDWLLWDLRPAGKGAQVTEPKEAHE